MFNYQFTCRACGRTTYCDYNCVTKTYENRAVTREECAFCGFICYNCHQLQDAREKALKEKEEEATIRKNRTVGTIKENLTVEDEVVNQDAELV